MSSAASTVRTEARGEVLVVTIDRPEVRNAVDAATAEALAEVCREFEADESAAVAVLTGAGGTFCAGYDLNAVAEGATPRLDAEGEGPMGPTRMALSKPVVAAVEGHAVAGGLELALWADLRVAATDAVFGVFCRRWGVPLVDGGTIRLPRLIGHSRALDMILTGRAVAGEEAFRVGLANRLSEPGATLDDAVALARHIASFPSRCMRSDRASSYEQWDLPMAEALRNELDHGMETIRSGETGEGARRFAGGAGRHGSFEDG